MPISFKYYWVPSDADPYLKSSRNAQVDIKASQLSHVLLITLNTINRDSNHLIMINKNYN